MANTREIEQQTHFKTDKEKWAKIHAEQFAVAQRIENNLNRYWSDEKMFWQVAIYHESSNTCIIDIFTPERHGFITINHIEDALEGTAVDVRSGLISKQDKGRYRCRFAYKVEVRE